MAQLDEILGIENGMVIEAAACNWGYWDHGDSEIDDWYDPDPYDDWYDPDPYDDEIDFGDAV